MEEAEEVGLELAGVVGVSRDGAGGGADVEARAATVGDIHAVNRQEAENGEVLAVVGVEAACVGEGLGGEACGG